ncbi:MAG: YfcE family phosphodiesterase [Deltaproteobacteria bacterium]|nr:YfcE family phosphodiesterase [Deltaproteobacteria bacterium]
MKIGVVSDSHGHVENLRRAIKAIKGAGVDLIVHLGDDYDDVTALADQGEVPITQVPGVFSTYYQDPGIPNRLIEEWEGIKALITHTPEAHENDLPCDLKPELVAAQGEVRLVLVGHSHIPVVKEEGGVIWVNPGHLKDDDKKGYPPTYAILEVVDSEVLVRIIDLFAAQELFVYP